jgi:hypothetical protein
MLRKSKTPYLRDVYLAYLINGARRTRTDEFPIIEEWMVSKEPPKGMIQWDRRRDVINEKETAINFYCSDYTFTPILGNPKLYVEKLKRYGMVIGMDASPYDNMPICVQKSQIYLNLAITYYFGKQGIKVIPNVRIGDIRTISSLEAYPKHTLIAIGTNGFTKKIENRNEFANQAMIVIDKLLPTGICVYGPVANEIFDIAKLYDIPIYQYDSYTMKENAKDKVKKLSRVTYER